MKTFLALAWGAACSLMALQGCQGHPSQATAAPAAASPPPATDARATRRPVGAATAGIPPRAADASSKVPPDATPVDVAALPSSAVSGLLVPVVGVAPGDLVDTYTQARASGRVHDAIDIMAPRGTPVVAANDGRVVKLFDSVPGGLTMYQFGPQQRVVYYYAHLDRYAPGLAEGQILHRGDPVGFVGSTGNASEDAPHLHFEVGVLGPEKQWWRSTPINPYGRFEGQP